MELGGGGQVILRGFNFKSGRSHLMIFFLTQERDMSRFAFLKDCCGCRGVSGRGMTGRKFLWSTRSPVRGRVGGHL